MQCPVFGAPSSRMLMTVIVELLAVWSPGHVYTAGRHFKALIYIMARADHVT